ncbi:MAG: type I methionyl aminopeptidase [Candidatus Cloacimonetes bacterium]|nr:type I methionyl aminopeptidase [Candidatus Cloacimonadota bacterium]
MVQIKNAEEIKKMRESNRIVAELLQELKSRIKPGTTTYELDRFAEDYIRSEGGKPSFKGYQISGLSPFPSAICASVNSCIVHGIPSKKVTLKNGDIIGIDIGVFKNGFHGDAAYTYVVGETSRETEKLLEVTREALKRGIEQTRAGARVGDISYAIGSYVRSQGYFVADNLTGHGVGRELHEDPVVPNKGKHGRGPRLKNGMTIAIEPMVNIGTNRVKEKGWEFFVADGSLSAHFEHTVLVQNGNAEILTENRED